jgi:hypothetical protein
MQINYNFIIYEDFSSKIVTDTGQDEWADKAKGLLKSELAKRSLSMKDLAERLEKLRIIETPPNLSNKIARGAFSAAFLLQCLTAIGCDHIRLDP